MENTPEQQLPDWWYYQYNGRFYEAGTTCISDQYPQVLIARGTMVEDEDTSLSYYPRIDPPTYSPEITEQIIVRPIVRWYGREVRK